MTGRPTAAWHRQQAALFLRQTDKSDLMDVAAVLVAQAQVHATLALSAPAEPEPEPCTLRHLAAAEVPIDLSRVDSRVLSGLTPWDGGSEYTLAAAAAATAEFERRRAR